jgi:hypothetical protein
MFFAELRSAASAAREVSKTWRYAYVEFPGIEHEEGSIIGPIETRRDSEFRMTGDTDG